MIEFTKHTDQGTPGFASEGNTYSITTENGERGRWLGIHPDEVQPGDTFRITCGIEEIADEESKIATLVITFWSGRPSAKTYIGSSRMPQEPEIDEVVIIPNEAILFRVELRNWGVGFAKFIDVIVEYPYEKPPPVEPPIEPPVEPPIEKPYWAVYRCPSPSGEVIWTVTVSENSGTLTKGYIHDDASFDLVDEMAATEPDEPAELLPPGNMDDW